MATLEEVNGVQGHLQRLKTEHRDLDDVIVALSATAWHDEVRMQRLKRRKLQVRDAIREIESDILPDIIA
ncbi:MAG: DUF465 domain-containing protein [Alphaproteobacteria bacterium]|nr:MAG: DUF465 domain-containing protein [Alphaproteobacteria bacterium]